MTADIAIPSHDSTCFPHFEGRDPDMGSHQSLWSGIGGHAGCCIDLNQEK
ncbi:hypothetical protein [Brucella anthropi]